MALGNDLAYVVQAVVGSTRLAWLCRMRKFTEQKLTLSGQAPNFVWKTTDFPAARKGYLWCIIMQILLGMLPPSPKDH